MSKSTVILLVVIGCILLAIANVALWATLDVFNADRFGEHVAEGLQSEASAEALAGPIVDRLMFAYPEFPALLRGPAEEVVVWTLQRPLFTAVVKETAAVAHKAMTTSDPASPVSSPMMAKMKSVWAFGRKNQRARLAPSTVRRATSAVRSAATAVSRFVTFTHAIASTRRLPSIMAQSRATRIAAAPVHCTIHHPDFAGYAGSDSGDAAALDGAKALAMTALDFLSDAGLRERVREAFAKA